MRALDAGMALRERRESAPWSEKVMAVLGMQEWFSRADVGDRQRPRGSKLGAVKVCVLINIWFRFWFFLVSFCFFQ